MKDIKNSTPKVTSQTPAWSFQIVLAALTKAPFELLTEVALHYTLMETLFLMA